MVGVLLLADENLICCADDVGVVSAASDVFPSYVGDESDIETEGLIAAQCCRGRRSGVLGWDAMVNGQTRK